MANIWLVLYVASKVTGAWGPMPYHTVEDCGTDATMFNNLAVTALDATMMDKPTFQCEASDLAPVIGTQLKLGVPVVPKGKPVIPDSQRN